MALFTRKTLNSGNTNKPFKLRGMKCGKKSLESPRKPLHMKRGVIPRLSLGSFWGCVQVPSPECSVGQGVGESFNPEKNGTLPKSLQKQPGLGNQDLKGVWTQVRATQGKTGKWAHLGVRLKGGGETRSKRRSVAFIHLIGR